MDLFGFAHLRILSQAYESANGRKYCNVYGPIRLLSRAQADVVFHVFIFTFYAELVLIAYLFIYRAAVVAGKK